MKKKKRFDKSDTWANSFSGQVASNMPRQIWEEVIALDPLNFDIAQVWVTLPWQISQALPQQDYVLQTSYA